MTCHPPVEASQIRKTFSRVGLFLTISMTRAYAIPFTILTHT